MQSDWQITFLGMRRDNKCAVSPYILNKICVILITERTLVVEFHSKKGRKKSASFIKISI